MHGAAIVHVVAEVFVSRPIARISQFVTYCRIMIGRLLISHIIVNTLCWSDIDIDEVPQVLLLYMCGFYSAKHCRRIACN